MSGEQTLLDLAARCEAATGPDRELDGAMASLLHPEVQRVTIGPDHRREDWVFIDRSEAAPSSRPVTRYTASLDAAMMLYVRVPERVPSNPRLAAAEALRQRAWQALHTQAGDADNGR